MIIERRKKHLLLALSLVSLHLIKTSLYLLHICAVERRNTKTRGFEVWSFWLCQLREEGVGANFNVTRVDFLSISLLLMIQIIMERLDQGHLHPLLEHPETIEPEPPASQASTLAKSYSHSLLSCYSEPLQLFLAGHWQSRRRTCTTCTNRSRPPSLTRGTAPGRASSSSSWTWSRAPSSATWVRTRGGDGRGWQECRPGSTLVIYRCRTVMRIFFVLDLTVAPIRPGGTTCTLRFPTQYKAWKPSLISVS